MTLPDLVTHFFPSVHLSSCRQVLQDVLGLDLYRGNRYVYYYIILLLLSVAVLSFQFSSLLFIILYMISRGILKFFFLLFDSMIFDYAFSFCVLMI